MSFWEGAIAKPGDLRVTLWFRRSEPDEAPPINRLRWVLKILGRRFGFRCVDGRVETEADHDRMQPGRK